MIIYNYDNAGVFTSESLADESPLEQGVFLIPAMATEIAPPETTDGKRVVWNGTAWELQDEPLPLEESPEYLAMIEAREAEAAAKAEARAALLERLGITADEAALLLG